MNATLIPFPAPAAPQFTVEPRAGNWWAVLGRHTPSPVYAGDRLTVCTTDGQGEADMIAAALNAYPPAATWPDD
jgi:hypothetical protein